MIQRGGWALDDDDDGQWTAQIKKTNHRKKNTKSSKLIFHLLELSFHSISALHRHPSCRSVLLLAPIRCFIVAERTPSIVEEGWMRSNCDCRKNFVIFSPSIICLVPVERTLCLMLGPMLMSLSSCAWAVFTFISAFVCLSHFLVEAPLTTGAHTQHLQNLSRTHTRRLMSFFYSSLFLIFHSINSHHHTKWS